MIARLFILFGFVASFNCETTDDVGIVGGHQIPIENAPYMVSLRIDGTHHWCGGSIIHKRFILTAAHCIKPNHSYKILVGAATAEDKHRGNGKLYKVAKIIPHKKYNPLTFDFDVCLMKLARPLKFGSKVAIINIADYNVHLSKNTMVNVTGWGSNGNNLYTTQLQQVSVPVVSRFECQEPYSKHHINITHQMICAGKLGADSCQGDSGGPLTRGNVQVGITSFGLDCGKAPGIYIRTKCVSKWIKNTILHNC